MPNHTSKKKKGQPLITIDEKHTQMLNEFYTVENDKIPELEQQRLMLKHQIHALDEVDIDKQIEDGSLFVESEGLKKVAIPNLHPIDAIDWCAKRCLDKNDLVIHSASADDGPVFKRFRPRSQGRGFKIKKPTCHIRVSLTKV